MENTAIKAIQKQKNMAITTGVVAAIVLPIITVLFILTLVFSNNADAGVASSMLREVDTPTDYKWASAIGGGIAAIGFIGAGIGQGYAAGKAAEAVGRNPEAESKIRNMMFIGSAVAESSALYALVIAIMCIFVA